MVRRKKCVSTRPPLWFRWKSSSASEKEAGLVRRNKMTRENEMGKIKNKMRTREEGGRKRERERERERIETRSDTCRFVHVGTEGSPAGRQSNKVVRGCFAGCKFSPRGLSVSILPPAVALQLRAGISARVSGTHGSGSVTARRYIYSTVYPSPRRFLLLFLPFFPSNCLF